MIGLPTSVIWPRWSRSLRRTSSSSSVGVVSVSIVLGHLRLEGHLGEHLVDRDERRDADQAQVAVLVVEERPRRDDAVGLGAAGEAGALAGALGAVEPAGR